MRGCATVQQLSVVKLKVLGDNTTKGAGLIWLPGKSPLTDMVAWITSLLAGGSVKLHPNRKFSTCVTAACKHIKMKYREEPQHAPPGTCALQI